MINALISRSVILVFGVLYPAYSSYKALKTKNTRELVRMTMYWIIYAFFTTFECVGDIFISWFPFYYELKVLFLIWLLSPATNGTSYLYRKFIHPQLEKHEEEIDKYIAEASKRGCETILNFGARGMNLAANTVLTTAIQSQDLIASRLRRSHSTGEIDSAGTKDKVSRRSVLEHLPEEEENTTEVVQMRKKRATRSSSKRMTTPANVS